MTTKCGTKSIGHRAAENGFHAIRYAGESGRPINSHITISFVTLGIDDEEAGPTFRKIQINLARWWRYRNQKHGIGPLIGVYAHANPNGRRHVHWLLHLPEAVRDEFVGALEKQLGKITGLKDLGNGLHVQRVDTPGSVGKYIFRGIDPAYAAYFHLEAANEGTVSCRRTGTTRVIGRSARKSAGWVRKKRKGNAAMAA